MLEDPVELGFSFFHRKYSMPCLQIKAREAETNRGLHE